MSDINSIPGWNSNTPITEKGDRPSVVFINWMNLMLSALKANVTSINNSILALQAQQATFLAAQNSATTAQLTAATAQATADSGGAARSGNATGTINVGSGWSAACQVDLLTVSAGNLTIEGTGPLQDVTTDITPPGIYTAAWRVVEIVGAVETVVFTGSYDANHFTINVTESIVEQLYLYNTTDTSAGAVTIPRASVGSVSYRLDLQGVSGVVFYNVIGTLFVRRS